MLNAVNPGPRLQTTEIHICSCLNYQIYKTNNESALDRAADGKQTTLQSVIVTFRCLGKIKAKAPVHSWNRPLQRLWHLKYVRSSMVNQFLLLKHVCTYLKLIVFKVFFERKEISGWNKVCLFHAWVKTAAGQRCSVFSSDHQSTAAQRLIIFYES